RTHATGEVGLARLNHRRYRDIAQARTREVAPIEEPAALGPVPCRGYRPADRAQACRTTTGLRDSRQQSRGVRVPRSKEDVVDGPVLDHLAGVHHRDLLA